MLSLTVRLFAGIAAIALVPAAASAQAAKPGASSATVPAIPYRTRTLANGLRVFTIADKSSPNASVQVWYDVGSKDDPAGRSGFAHLFEHFMFKATRNMVAEQLDRLTEDVGGFNNASTYDDYTNYYEMVPANHIERLIWAEAERMGSLAVEESYFASERDVVKEEYRSRVLAQPYGKLFYLYLPQTAYDVHPYGRPGIGSIEDLDAASLADVRAFHATYYRPDNAVLVVAGNFDQAQLDGWIDRYFAPIARPSFAIPRVRVSEPLRTKARSFTVHEPNTPLPAVAISFPAPPASSRDAVVLELIEAILSRGQSSRLYQSLVYRSRLATSAETYRESKQGQGVMAAYAILASGKSAADGEAALRAEFARLRSTPVTPAELAEAKNELLTAALRERETVDGKASALAEAVILRGDPKAADRRLTQLAATHAADILRVARTWLTDPRSTAIRYLPQEGDQPSGDSIATAPTVRTVKLATPASIRVVTPTSDAKRVAPPAIGAEIATPVPVPVVQKLANGLTLVTVARPALPLVSMSLISPHGSASDSADKAGLARIAAGLMTKGTATHSATEVAQAVEALGGSLGASADHDGAGVSLTVKSDQLSPALALLADVVRNPAFAAEELGRQRAISIDDLSVTLQDPGQIAALAASRALFGAGAYGQSADGSPATLRAIGRDDVVAAYRRAFQPSSSTLILAGDVDPARARILADKYFGDWAGAAGASADAPTSAASPTRGKLIVVDMPGSGQAAVAVAREGIARSDPRFYPALVANAVFGGGYSSRLNQEIRIKRGLAYGAGSQIDPRRAPGPIIAATQTKNESAAEVLGLILAEMRRLGAQPISMAELGTRQAVLKGSFGRRLETTSGLAGLVGDYILQDVSLDELARFQPGISAVTPDQAGAAAHSLYAPEGATTIIVGDAAKFADALKAQGHEVDIIKLADLKLDNAALR